MHTPDKLFYVYNSSFIGPSSGEISKWVVCLNMQYGSEWCKVVKGQTRMWKREEPIKWRHRQECF